MANNEMATLIAFDAGSSSSGDAASGSNHQRSTTPPLTVQQQMEFLKNEVVAMKRKIEVSMNPLNFSWENIPEFNPGKNLIPINKWIRLVEEKAYFSRWDDVTTTRFVVTKLEGRAREWYLAGEFAHKNWEQLKMALRNTFDLNVSSTGLIFKDAATYSSDSTKTFVSYFHEKLQKLNCLNWDIPEQEKVNIIIHGVVKKDVRQMALANNYKRTDELLTYLRGCDLDNIEDSKDERRPVSLSSSFKIRCYFCHETGHTKNSCPKRRFNRNVYNRPNNIFCRFCKKPGHIENSCRYKNKNFKNFEPKSQQKKD